MTATTRSPASIDTGDLTEDELNVVSEALSEYITTREDGESCQECSSYMESEAGWEVNHDHDCPVATAHQLREKLGVMVSE